MRGPSPSKGEGADGINDEDGGGEEDRILPRGAEAILRYFRGQVENDECGNL